MTPVLPRLLAADVVRAAALDAEDSRAFRLEVLRRLRSVLEFEWYVWILTDPLTGVGVDPVARIPDRNEIARAIRLKYLEPVNRWTTLQDAASLGDHAPTSRLWRELQHPVGVADVASVVLRDDAGCWGFLDLWSARRFDRREVALLRALVPALSGAVRILRGRTFGGVIAPQDRRGPAVFLLDESLNVVGATPAGDPQLRTMLPTPEQFPPIPAAVYNVAAQLLAREAGVDTAEPVARMPVSDGSWVRVSAARAQPSSVIAVTIEPATAEERLAVFVRAHGLSQREREVMQELSRGASTAQIAKRLFLSPYTVQDHLTSIFDRTGVRSRRELLAHATGRAVAEP